ncbi:hypothetical protein [Pseudonocardia halophobica]|nr:hypothetical protein [Pseudonocardia halophobica]
MNAVLDGRADLAGPEAGDDGIGGTAGAGDEEHVLAALYGDEAEFDADVDAALLERPNLRVTSTGRNTDDMSQIAGRAVARGGTARNARR